LILVDTSVWIDYFRPSPGPAGFELRRMIEEAEAFALTGVVLAEILRGLKRDVSRVEHFLSQWELLEPRGFSTYREAAAISRLARSQGINLKTIDTLIAAVAIENRASLFSMDKDFSEIIRVAPLRLYPFPRPT
jgi:predicted nucleic acid-binding protein